MRFMPRAASAVLLALMLPASSAAQSRQAETDIVPLGSVFPADVVRDLPLGDNVYSLLETTQAEVISDRFNSGGLNVGGDSRAGGFLGSWSQTLFRVGDIDVSDPLGSGSAMLFPDVTLWQSVSIATGLMPADINTPGLAITLEPPRAGNAWTRVFSGSGSGGGLAATGPADQPIPIARLDSFAHGSAFVSGPLSPRASLVAAGTWARGATYRREQLTETDDTNGSGFAHFVFAPSSSREWRMLAWVQRARSPLENWQAFQAPSSSTTNTSVHVQSTLEHRPTDAAGWRVFGGFTQRARTNEVDSATAIVERITVGPVPNLVDSAADNTVRRLSLGGRYAPYRTASARHRLEFGANTDYASTTTSGAFTGTVRETVDGIPARVWSYVVPGSDSSRGATTVSAYATDVIRLASSLRLDAGVRAEFVHGSADGAATSINWISLLPHAYLRWQLGERRALIGGYARSANALNQTWLAYGDPAASVATVASAAATNVIVSRVGPGTGGNASFSAIDEDLKRPYTDEFIIGFEKRRSASTRYTLTGIARREGNLLGVLNTGVPAGSYSTIEIPDLGWDHDGSADDRPLPVYNRLPASFGKDTYLVTNPGHEAATAFGLRMSFEHSTERLFLLFGATASAAEGTLSNRGYGPLENDQDLPGEVFTNPNAASYARGRLFTDRAFTIKWTTLYRFPGDFSVGGIARYQDGQPFSRIVVAENLNQGTEGVQAYPNAGSRFTFTGTFDLRVQKGFRVGSARIDGIFDVYNLFTRSNEVEEDVVTGPDYRTSTAIQPPHSVHFGVRLTF